MPLKLGPGLNQHHFSRPYGERSAAGRSRDIAFHHMNDPPLAGYSAMPGPGLQFVVAEHQVLQVHFAVPHPLTEFPKPESPEMSHRK